jgi:hypothetical protein
VEYLAKTGGGPVIIDLRIKVEHKRGQPGEWVEVTVTTPRREEAVLFQEELPLANEG